MFKILSLLAVVIQLLPTNGLTVTSREDTGRFDGIIEEDFAARFDVQTTYEDFALSVQWKAKLLEKFDYHVAIESKTQDLAYCSGAVVQEGQKQFIITAARCVEGHSAKDLKIRYYTAEREVGGVTSDISDVYLPFGPEPKDPRLQVAILYPVRIIRNMTPLKLPSKENTYEDDVVVTGWPTLYPVNQHTNLLLYTKQPLLNESECRTHGGFLCAGVRSNKTSYCHVTTGSPLVATKKNEKQKYLLGFLMADKGCRREITPTPYLDLAALETYKDGFFNHKH